MPSVPRRRLHRLAIDFQDHIARLQAGVVGRAARLYLLDHRAVKTVRRLQLLAHIRSDVGQPDSPARFALADVRGFIARLVALAHSFESDRSSDVLAVAHHLQMNGCAGILLSDYHLQSAGVAHFLAVDLGDHIADFQARLGARRIGFDLGDDRARGFVNVEELRVVRGDVGRFRPPCSRA